MSSIQLVVFDIAGTTVRDTGNVAKAFIDAFREFDIEVPTSPINHVMGFRKKDAIRLLLAGDNNDVLIEQIHEAFIRNMLALYENGPELTPLPQVEETFQQLKQWGIKIALNTGFTRPVTDAILQRLQWTIPETIDMVLCSDEVTEGRPQPDMIKTIMQQMDITDSKAVVKVGDTRVDVEEGRNAGCGLVVSVTTGAYTRSELALCKPDYIIDSIAELPALFPVQYSAFNI
ncbi:MAG TPA: HAD-IA family hydrolase [Niastella sp.]